MGKLVEKCDDTKEFKEKIAQILTWCNAEQRGLVAAEYPEYPNQKVMDDITEKLKKGYTLSLCNDFFFPSISSFNASVIDKAFMNEDYEKIGDVLCTQSNAEIKQIIAEYHRLHNGANLGEKVRGLCKRRARNSIRIIFDSLLSCKRNENDLSVDMKSVQNDVAFLINTRRFKLDEKQKLIRIFCDNHWFYIRCLAKQYEQVSTSLTLTQLISKNLGDKGSGYLTLILLKYSLDPIEYFCQVLTDLGSKNFDKNKAEIARIFLARSELDLNEIRSHFEVNYDLNGLDNWILQKSKGSKFGFFLICILKSIDKRSMKSGNVRHKKVSVNVIPRDSIKIETLPNLPPSPKDN